MMKLRRTQQCRGFLIMDMLIGMTLLGVLALVLAVSVRSQQKGAAHLNDSRAALRAAEATLIDLQTGAKELAARHGVSIRVTDQNSAAAPIGYRWVRVEATCNGRVATLDGLVGQTR